MSRLASRPTRDKPKPEATTETEGAPAEDARARFESFLASAEGQAIVGRCVAVYRELSEERLRCILAAGDAVTVSGCLPQADR